MSDSLSLYEIERELAELLAAREEATEPEQCTELENAIRLYVEGQVRKVDGVRAYVRNCEAMAAAAKEEAERQAERARVWTEKGKRFKQFILDVMQAFGLKKLEGRTGTLTVCSNGGKQPVTITDETLVPDEYCSYTLTFTGAEFAELLRDMKNESESFGLKAGALAATARRKADEDRMREALQAGPVAGARLEPRGVHLRVK